MTSHQTTPNQNRFCAHCGAATAFKIPDGDSKPRAVCQECETIHYENPKNVVGTIPTVGDKILLCQRSIEPGYGLWTLPAGFMECGESLAAGAARETFEEACAVVTPIEPVFALIDIPHIGQTHVFFRAVLNENDFAAGHETLAVKLFAFDELPWDDIAFNSVKTSLQLFIADHERGQFGTHHRVLTPTMK